MACVFEFASHKTEYLGELQVIRNRRITFRASCLADLERLFAAAMKLDQIGRRLSASVAVRGAYGVIDGLLHNWLLDPSAFGVRFKLMWRLDYAACLKSVAQNASHCRFARFSRGEEWCP